MIGPDDIASEQARLCASEHKYCMSYLEEITQHIDYWLVRGERRIYFGGEGFYYSGIMAALKHKPLVDEVIRLYEEKGWDIRFRKERWFRAPGFILKEGRKS